MHKAIFRSVVVLTCFSLVFLCAEPLQMVNVAKAIAPQKTGVAATSTTQDAQSFYNELTIIHLTNLKRREYGLPPLRWNQELQEAARWFAGDAAGRAAPYCGHTDTLDRTPGDRFIYFGYRNIHAWGENVVCGLTRPESAINGWMNSTGHRQNLLHPLYREIGVGYAQNATTGRGYIAQEFSFDPSYAPVIIENEAISVASPTVNLYIYDPAGGNGLEAMGAAVEMMIANQPDFEGAVWEPYSAEKPWTLTAGEGWRSVYVKVRDAYGRISTVSDMIYLGETLPINNETLALNLPCSFNDRITVRNLDQAEWPQVQLSVNWQGDDGDITFEDLGNIGARVDDGGAAGQSAHRLPAGANGDLRYWTTNFHKNTSFVAYFRLKATNINTAEPLVQLSIKGGGTEYGPITLTGANFTTANEYQEFALPFTFNENATDPYLIFTLHHTGASEINVDTVTIYTAAMPSADPLEWPVLGGYHRSRGIWARYVKTDGTFSAPTEINIFDAAAARIPAPVPTPTPSPTPTTTPLPPEDLSSFVYLPITVNR